MADEAPALIWASRPDKCCEFVNRAWLAFTGRTFELETGDGWAARVHPNDLDRCLATYHWAFEARQPFRVEFRLQREDGHYRRMAEWGMPRVDGQGVFRGYAALCCDVTEREQAERTLKNSQTLRYAALASLPGHVAAIAKDGRIIAVNPAWVQFGQANGAALDAIGIDANYRSVCRRAADQGDPDAQAALQGLEAVLAGQRERFVAEYPCHAPGVERWFELAVHPLKSPVKGAILSHWNVTERQLAETFLRCLAQEQREQAEDALQRLTRHGQQADT